MANKVKLKYYLQKHWLLIGILCCILLASIYPKLGAKGGPLRPEYTVKYGAIATIFLISGFTLKSERIGQTLQQRKLHLFVQLFTFGFFPVFVHLVLICLRFMGVNPWIIKGFITVACMPPPVSSAVIFTRAANGNETAAIFNSILGSFLGVLITPLLLLINLGFTTIFPIFAIFTQLFLTVLLPLIVGQLVRRLTNVRAHSIPLDVISQVALLAVIYNTFCDTLYAPMDMGLNASDILITVFIVHIILSLVFFIAFNMAKRIKIYSRQDVAAIVFCSTHKSLTLGIPILRVMFYGYSHLTQISLPLLMYHPTQMILSGLVVNNLKEWVHSSRHKRLPI